MRQLMQLINSGNLKSGSAILWDEAGIDISSKNWQSLTNKLINFLLQTFRHKQFILIFTSPYLDYVDASTRKLFHAEFSTISIDYRKKTTKIKPHLIQYNARSKKFYYKYLRVRTQLRGVAPIKAWNVPKPSKGLIEQYESIKNKFTKDLNEDIEKQLDEIENNKASDNQKKPLTAMQEQVRDLMSNGNSVQETSRLLNVNIRTIFYHISVIKRKGYTIEKIKAKNPQILLENT